MTGTDIEEMIDAKDLEYPDSSGAKDYRSDWKIFIPTLLILIIYGLAVVYLWATGRADGALFRLAILICGVGVPLLTAHAFLRYETICVRLLPNSIHFNRGWPKNNTTVIPYELITRLSVKRGLIGHLFGGGTLVIQTKGGAKTAISDLKSPDLIISNYNDMNT